MATTITLDADKAMFEKPTAQVFLKICLNEPWQCNIRRTQVPFKRWPVLLNQLVKTSGFRLMTLVAIR